MYVIKKDGTREEFNVDKIIAAVNKSAARILYEFSTDEIAFICQFAYDRAESLKKDGSFRRAKTAIFIFMISLRDWIP